MNAEPLVASAFLPDLVQAGLLTYVLHSTLLLLGTWLLLRLFKRMPVAWQETLWRTALLGGLLTAGVQTALGGALWSERVSLPRAPETEVARSLGTPTRGTVQPAPADPASLAETAYVPPSATPSPLPVVPVVRASVEADGSAASAPIDGSRVFALLWLGGVLFAALRRHVARRKLHAQLARRRPLHGGPLGATLDRLLAAAPLGRPVRLTISDALRTPVAFGIRRPEICVPERATRDLTAAQQEAMLAHELAHLLRRDPLWLLAGRALEALLFFQPLNLLAVRRLRETAEVLSDAWAVRQTGARRALAECLTEVAGWALDRPRAAALLPSMAHRGSSLTRRVRRLLGDGRLEPEGRRTARGVLALGALLSVAALAPAVVTAEAAGPATPPQASAPERAEAPREVTTVDAALAALDEEIGRLERETRVLVSLLEQVTDEPALRAGMERLRTRLGALRTRRDALLEIGTTDLRTEDER